MQYLLVGVVMPTAIQSNFTSQYAQKVVQCSNCGDKSSALANFLCCPILVVILPIPCVSNVYVSTCYTR